MAPPLAPNGGRLWEGFLVAAWVVVGLFLLDRFTILLADYWLFQSLGYEGVFWTNVRAGAALFVLALGVNGAWLALSVTSWPVGRRGRRAGIQVGLLLGLVAGVLLATRYRDLLLAVHGLPFGERDPVFGHDVGFYVFRLPAIRIAVLWWLLSAVAALVVSLVTWLLTGAGGRGRRGLLLAGAWNRASLANLLLLAGAVAAAVWLKRYEILYRDNSDSGIFTGASYVDVTGVLSLVNYYAVTAVVVVGAGGGLAYILRERRRASGGRAAPGRSPGVRRAVAAGLLFVAFDLAFRVGVLVRDVILVSPNEPVIQLEYIRRHIDATRRGYDLERIETVSFLPARPGDPVPDADSFLATATLRNAPLWPGFVSYLEQLIDPQHANRILQTGGDPTVYGPVLEIFRQQQKLRTYYDFLDVDAVRYRVNGEPRMYVSAVRELPLIEPQPWLAWWGQRFVLFTHGYGLVMAPVGAVRPTGEPRYASWEIPPRVSALEFRAENPSVYYGEGAATMAYSNVRRMKEFDYPTEEGRAEVVFPPDVRAGVPLDNLLKRLVFGWRSRQFFEIVFSRLIGDETRVHYYRTPLERVGRVAPFLYLDMDPYAVVVDGRIVWLVNGITTTDRYPYSQRDWLGDKSDERSPYPRPWVRTNYVRDAVKATVDAFTGAVCLYRIVDEPIVATWSRIYPGLLLPADSMPPGVREHLQYPVQLFHIQFDDIYNIYHMADPMTFFNMEDMWDDGDEVLGPILDQGRAITFSIEPYPWLAETGDVLPAARGPRVQFALSMAFTPERALNLRAIPVAYQDGEDYGRLVVLQVPKGYFYPGPEQADAAIDQDPEISQQFSWWNRRGTEVIRGHTTTLVVGREVLYVEPVFIRSQQNPVTELKKVVVVFRGHARMGDTLEEALRRAVTGAVGSPGWGLPEIRADGPEEEDAGRLAPRSRRPDSGRTAH